MIEVGQAVYFVEIRGTEPAVKFGIVRDKWKQGKGTISILDAIEDVDIFINKD